MRRKLHSEVWCSTYKKINRASTRFDSVVIIVIRDGTKPVHEILDPCFGVEDDES